MKKRIIISLALFSTVLLALAVVAQASVPPPPVNQYVGIHDGIFNNLTEPDCRACHDNPGQFPGIMPNLITKDRHHVLTNPPPVGHGDECALCHVLFIDPNTGTVTPIVQRNCLACHTQFPGQASVHHVLPRAQNGDCKACHGTKIVSNMGDGHYIPTYTPSIITPYPSQGTGPVTNSRGNKSGACDFCHDSGTDLSTGVSIPVSDNMTTHHSTGFGTPAQPVGSPYCLWCHVNGDPNYQPINIRIRTCEGCHGPETLHNIQVSSVSPGSPANPGNEAPYFGHIGNDVDCKGCHGPQAVMEYSPAPYSGPTAVSISGMSAAVVPAGQDVPLAINGSGFVNLVNAGGTSLTLSSKVLLTSATGETTLLTPSSIDAANIVVTVPASLAVGAYKLNVAKVSATDAVLGVSGPKTLAVVGPVTISSASAANGVLTITGSGFGAQPTFDGQAIDAVSVNGVACKVSSWADTQIMAACAAVNNGDPVVVTTLMNGASAAATVANQSPVAVATATPSTTSTKKLITFDGSNSYDPDGTIVKWEWNFGNGVTKSGSIVTNSYSKRGTYTVTLTVTDDKGATGSAAVKVTITSAGKSK